MTAGSAETLESLIGSETSLPAPELAQHWIEEFQTTPGVAAVLFYGSGLRQTTAEESDEMVFDFYLLVDRYRDFDPRHLLALAGAVVPPNVYYREKQIGERSLRCKFAVLTVAQFLSAAQANSFTPHIWARFCQPARISYAADDALRSDLVDAITAAVLHFHRRTLHLVDTCTLRDFWRAGLQSTYSDEIRSEKQGRGGAIFDCEEATFTGRSQLALQRLPEMGRIDADGTVHSIIPKSRKRVYRLGLLLKRPLTKGVIVIRLIKAAFTFQGGLDYARWKIERHSGVRMEITDFQRRHPLLGGLSLFWKVLRRRGLR